MRIAVYFYISMQTVTTICDHVFIVKFATRQEAIDFYLYLLSGGVSCYVPAGTCEVQGVGISPEGVLDALSERGCAPVATGVGWGQMSRLEAKGGAPYGILWGDPWYYAREKLMESR